MSIKEVEIMIGGIPHTVQVNDADKGAAELAARYEQKAAKAPANKARAPKQKAAKAPDPSVESASDPDASE